VQTILSLSLFSLNESHPVHNNLRAAGSLEYYVLIGAIRVTLPTGLLTAFSGIPLPRAWSMFLAACMAICCRTSSTVEPRCGVNNVRVLSRRSDGGISPGPVFPRPVLELEDICGISDNVPVSEGIRDRLFINKGAAAYFHQVASCIIMAICLSQPAVSQHIRKLEDVLDALIVSRFVSH
jgi:hypothetical protein